MRKLLYVLEAREPDWRDSPWLAKLQLLKVFVFPPFFEFAFVDAPLPPHIILRKLSFSAS